MQNFIESVRYKDYISKKIAVYMIDNNLPMTAIFRENLLEMIPKCNDIFEIIDWNYGKKTHDSKRVYSSIHYFLDKDTNNPGRLLFMYDELRFKILKNYLLHNITWSKEDVQKN